MNKRTFDIIMACKEETTKHYTKLDNVIEFLSKECGTPKEEYTSDVINRILFEALCDFIDTCDRPSAFIRIYKNIINGEHKDFADRLCTAFSLVRIRDDGMYVNGFKAEFFKDEVEKQEEKKDPVADFRKILDNAWIQHGNKGFPEADDNLNGANIKILNEYLKLFPNAKVVSLNDAIPVKKAADVKFKNFCCEFIFDGTENSFLTRKLMNNIEAYKKHPDFNYVDAVWDIIREINGLSFLWS